MKVITFFNEKGGVGKTSMSIMFASWLKYKHNVNVGVADLNNRLTMYRRREQMMLKETGQTLPDNIWPIVPVNRKDVKENMLKTGLGYSKWLNDEITSGNLKDCDIVLVDLPGNLSGNELTDLIAGQMISLVIMPIDIDVQTVNATLSVHKLFAKYSVNKSCKFPVASFFNQTQVNVQKNKYNELARLMMNKGVNMLPDMIAYTQRMSKLESETDNMRITYDYPDWEKPEFKGSKDIGTENLFIDVAKLLASAKDIAKTKPYDMSMFLSMKKNTETQDLNRQLSVSSFPELEVDIEDKSILERYIKNR